MNCKMEKISCQLPDFCEDMREQNEFMQKRIQSFIAETDLKKIEIVKNRLAELNIEFDEEIEKDRRFKRLVCVIEDDTETYYYNDGTSQGLRIVGFKYPFIPEMSFKTTL